MDTRYTIHLPLRNALAAVAVSALLWGVPWALWLTRLPRGGVRPAGRAAPVLTYVRGGMPGDQLAWSPTMLSLPTQYGFSRTGVERDPAIMAVLKPEVARVPYVERGPEAVPPPDFSAYQSAAEARTGTYRPPPVGPRVFARLTTPADNRQVEVDDSLRTRGFECPALAVLPQAEPGAALVTAVATVEVDAVGRVRHVFLEQPTGRPEADRALVRALYTGRAAAGTTNAVGRIRVFHWRAGAGASGERGA